MIIIPTYFRGGLSKVTYDIKFDIIGSLINGYNNILILSQNASSLRLNVYPRPACVCIVSVPYRSMVR